MDPYGIEASTSSWPGCTSPGQPSPDFGTDLTPGKQEARGASTLLIGVAALTLFFVPQLLQLFPALGGLQYRAAA